jgi:hypothetical protein
VIRYVSAYARHSMRRAAMRRAAPRGRPFANTARDTSITAPWEHAMSIGPPLAERRSVPGPHRCSSRFPHNLSLVTSAPRQGAGFLFVVTCEAAETRRPAEGASDHPSPGHRDEAAPGLRRLDDLEADASAMAAPAPPWSAGAPCSASRWPGAADAILLARLHPATLAAADLLVIACSPRGGRQNRRGMQAKGVFAGATFSLFAERICVRSIGREHPADPA